MEVFFNVYVGFVVIFKLYVLGGIILVQYVKFLEIGNKVLDSKFICVDFGFFFLNLGKFNEINFKFISFYKN